MLRSFGLVDTFRHSAIALWDRNAVGERAWGKLVTTAAAFAELRLGERPPFEKGETTLGRSTYQKLQFTLEHCVSLVTARTCFCELVWRCIRSTLTTAPATATAFVVIGHCARSLI